MKLVVLIISYLCGGVFSDGSLRNMVTLSQADKDELVRQHNNYRSGSGASNMMKMVILNFEHAYFFSTPVLMHGGLLCIAFCPSGRLSLDQNSGD